LLALLEDGEGAGRMSNPKVKGVEVEMATGNVYAPLELADADEMLIKAQLVSKIAEIIKRKGLTQTQAARLLGMPQPKLSILLSGRFRGVSERRLMDCLVKLGRDVQIVVKATPRSRKDGRLSIVFRLSNFPCVQEFPCRPVLGSPDASLRARATFFTTRTRST
jgi:predicted XRE-type DNA-binding protein